MKIQEKWLPWIFRLIIVISFCVNYAGIYDRKMDTNGDNFHYLLLAHSLASGDGYYSTIGPVPTPHTHFPPGYPAFMSVFLRIFPGNIPVMKLLNGILMLVSLLLLFRIIRKSTGRYGLWYALIACLLCTFHSILLRWATMLMSEMLYTAISLGIVAICLDLDLEKVRQKEWRHILLLVGLCLLVASAFLVRTMGLSIILATALAFIVLAGKALIQKQEGRKWLMPALAGVLVLLSLWATSASWNMRNQRVSPGWKSDYMVSFSIPSQQELPNGKAKFWAERIGDNLQAFVPYYIPMSVLNPGMAQKSKRTVDLKDGSWIVGLLVIALMLIGLLSMKGLQWLLISYFIITFGVLCIYPPKFADTRYFVPLIPLMLAAFVVGIGQAAAWILQKKWPKKGAWVPPVLAVVVVCTLIPGYGNGLVTYRRLASYPSYEDLPEMSVFQRYINACEVCWDFPPKRLAAVLKPEIYYIYSNFHHAVPLPRTGTPEEIIQYLEDNLVDVVIMDTWFPSTYRVLLPTLMKYPERFSVLWQEGEPESPTLLLGFLVPPGWQPEPKATEE